MLKHCIHSLFYNMEQTSRICRAACEKNFEEHGLMSFDEYIILDTVYCFPDICQRDLARMILKGASHTSKLLALLEKKGYIERPIDKKGNRIVKKIVLTQSGLKEYKAAASIALDYAEKIENIIGKEQTIKCSNFLTDIRTKINETNVIDFE